MFTYRARVDPVDALNIVCAFLRNSFGNTFGPNVCVDLMDDTEGDWILVTFRGTVRRCQDLKKKMRRLARGKPRFTIEHSIS